MPNFHQEGLSQLIASAVRAAIDQQQEGQQQQQRPTPPRNEAASMNIDLQQFSGEEPTD